MGLRIIGGNLRGKKLSSVPGITTRPTADRLRESLFNIIAFRLQKAIVLDLFAGTGALGIEALSRGAKFAAFIDNSTDAISVIKKNIASCKMEGSTHVIRWNIFQNLNCIKFAFPAFNLVFMDPPYNINAIKPALDNLHKSNALEDHAVVIVEHSSLEEIPNDISRFSVNDQRKYGKTFISFLTYDSGDGLKPVDPIPTNSR